MGNRIKIIQQRIIEFTQRQLDDHECHGAITITYRDNKVYEITRALKYRLSEPKIPFSDKEIISKAVSIGKFARTLIQDTDNLQLNIKLGGKRPPSVSLFYGPVGQSIKRE